jgi:integrase
MINSLPKFGIYLFHGSEADLILGLLYFRRGYERRRRRLAERLQNPRIRLISFKTMRHYKATMEYHRTKDILHVMQLVGHKNIRNTLVYTHLVSWESDEFVSKLARTVKEAQELVDSGFDYVTTYDGKMIFRKRK